MRGGSIRVLLLYQKIDGVPCVCFLFFCRFESYGFLPPKFDKISFMPNSSPIQRIIFGSPGTGKSYRIANQIIVNDLGIPSEEQKEWVVKTVFHPEYAYGDFMGKLLPFTKAGRVEYNFYAGHFLVALSKAYKKILAVIKEGKDISEAENVVLVIDELNRGNSSAIFGTVFQLLDRDKDGWSEYPVNISELEVLSILKNIGVNFKALKDGFEYRFPGESHDVQDYHTFQNRVEPLKFNLSEKSIKIPPNLSILATINTSDNSIYFMDNAFKRRWDWEFLNVDDYGQREVVEERIIQINEDQVSWPEFVGNLNAFIRSKYKEVRKIEDKQIGYFFINEEEITMDHVRNKLLFFVWDSVFSNNKRPLRELLELSEPELVTFGQFAAKAEDFVDRIMSHQS